MTAILLEGVYKKAALRPWAPPSSGDGEGSGGGDGGGEGTGGVGDILDEKSNDSHKEGKKRGEEIWDDKKLDDKDVTSEDLDKHSEQNEKKIEEDKDVAEGKVSPDSKSKANGNPGKGQGQTQRAPVVKSSVVNWKIIVRNFVDSSVREVEEETWRRPSRRAAATADVQMKQVGVAAMRPDIEIKEFVIMNCAIVVDTSGSMAHAVPRVFAELRNLMKDPKFKDQITPVMHFSDGPTQKYLVNVNQNKAAAVDSFSGKSKPNFNLTAKSVFEKFQSGGTDITGGVDQEIGSLLQSGYNVLLCTDTDVLFGGNIEVTKKYLYSTNNKATFFVLLSDQSQYDSAVNILKGRPRNLSHM